jgi:hypothetical protein
MPPWIMNLSTDYLGYVQSLVVCVDRIPFAGGELEQKEIGVHA